MGTAYNNPQNYVEMIDDVRCTINTVDEVIDGYIAILNLKKSSKKTENYLAVYNSLDPKEDYGVGEGKTFAFGLFVMHEIRNIFSHSERIAHLLDGFESNSKSIKELNKLLAEEENHPFFIIEDTRIEKNFKEVEKMVKLRLSKESVDSLYREHEYWFTKYKNFLQKYYSKQMKGEL